MIIKLKEEMYVTKYTFSLKYLRSSFNKNKRWHLKLQSLSVCQEIKRIIRNAFYNQNNWKLEKEMLTLKLTSMRN